MSRSTSVLDRLALVGIGVSLNQLTKAAQELFGKKSGYGQAGSMAQYGGGEHRDPNCERMVHAAVVSEGAALGSPEALAFAVLQQVLGAGPYITRGSHITSTLTTAINEATTQPFTDPLFTAEARQCVAAGYLAVKCITAKPSPTLTGQASAFNSSELDSGLSRDKAAADVITAAASHVKTVAQGKISETDIERGHPMTMETLDALLEEMGLQALATGTDVSPTSAVEQIKAITKKDVVKAEKTFASGTQSMAVSGSLVNAPFLDEL